MDSRFLRLVLNAWTANFMGVLVSVMGQSAMLARLARNTAGNTSLIVAASIAPLLALVGGGIDMGRSYLTESRLQQARERNG